MAKHKTGGWFNQTTRHSNARKFGKAGGNYANTKNKIESLFTSMRLGHSTPEEEKKFLKLLKKNIQYVRLDMYKGKTIGEVSNEMAQEYFDLYKKFKIDNNPAIREKAEELAKGDFLTGQMKNEFAEEKLNHLIQVDKLQEVFRKEGSNPRLPAGCVLGSKVEIFDRRGKIIATWHADGSTEAHDTFFQKIKPKLEELGLEGKYDSGRMD